MTLRNSLSRLAVLLLAALFVAAPLRADTDAEIEQALAKIRSELREVVGKSIAKDDELKAIRSFKRRIWKDWIKPWNANDKAIRSLRAEIEALKRMGAFNQNSLDLNNQMRALLAERAELEGLRGGTVDDCEPPCTDIHRLFHTYDARVRQEEQLVTELADLNRRSRQLDDAIKVQKAKLAENKAARDKLLTIEREKLTAERERYAELIKDPDTFLLPSLDGGPPRVMTREELILEVTVTYFEVGTSSNIDSPEFRAQVEALVRRILKGSQDLRARIGTRVGFLDTQIAALDRRLNGDPDNGGTAVAADQCPARNPDVSGQALSHRIPPGDESNYIACNYFADPAGGAAPGPIKSRVPYADGKEAGVVAYFTLDGGHHLDHIHNVHGPRQSGAKCTYFSASAIKEYRLLGHDGSEMVVFCKPDGTVGQCDYFTHDGRARRCSGDCRDKCGDLRQKIGWPAMK